MTADEITKALTDAGIPNPETRMDYNGGRYRVTAEHTVGDVRYSHGQIVGLDCTEAELNRTIESFRNWFSDLSENNSAV